jgi:hypothetical protein
MGTILFLVQGLLFIFLWSAGGCLIARSAFLSLPSEELSLSLIIGLILDILFANMLARYLPADVAFWLAALFVLFLGLGVAWGSDLKTVFRIPGKLWQWLFLLAVTLVFTMAERGMAIFDDYAHLPTLSLMATGAIPPPFALNASVVYHYHFLLMIFAAQLTRITGLEVWKSLDVSRALVFAISLLLVSSWALRLTRSRAAAFVTALFTALGMGVRWLLLLFPMSLINWLSGSVTLLGSGASSGNGLAGALANPWGVEGVGPVAFPFAFANGIFTPSVLEMSGPNSTVSTAMWVFYLLTFNRWRGWRGALVTGLMTASLALLAEFNLVLLLAGWGVLVLIYFLQHRSWRLPANLWQWLLVFVLGNVLGAVQGGAFTDIILGLVEKFTGHSAGSYQTMGFVFSLKPVIVSSHLGVLSLLHPQGLLLALIEIGPILLLVPLLAVWGYKAYRCGRWFEVALVLAGFLSFATVFLQYAGSAGVRNTSRLYMIIDLCALYAVPLAWMWVSRRSDRLKWIAGGLAAMMMFGGLVILSVKLVAIQRPVYSYFLTALDARMYDHYWDHLEPGALVFDPEPYRSPTVFGRPSMGFNTWWDATPQWAALRKNADPAQLASAGFHYAYFDNRYWREIGAAGQKRMSAACVRLVDEYNDDQGNFRRLLDLEKCKK